MSFKKFPEVIKEFFDSKLVANECKKCIGEYEVWREDTAKLVMKSLDIIEEQQNIYEMFGFAKITLKQILEALRGE